MNTNPSEKQNPPTPTSRQRLKLNTAAREGGAYRRRAEDRRRKRRIDGGPIQRTEDGQVVPEQTDSVDARGRERHSDVRGCGSRNSVFKAPVEEGQKKKDKKERKIMKIKYHKMHKFMHTSELHAVQKIQAIYIDIYICVYINMYIYININIIYSCTNTT